jgi:hypothetical protein
MLGVDRPAEDDLYARYLRLRDLPREIEKGLNVVGFWNGDIDAFRASCRHLDLHAAASIRVLSQLGHVEFDWDHRRFAAAPTTLTTIPGLPGRLVLTGARPNGLIAELATTAQRCTLDVDVWRDLCPGSPARDDPAARRQRAAPRARR